jgi:protein SCO1/2
MNVYKLRTAAVGMMLAIVSVACNSNEPLPIYGYRDVAVRQENGKTIVDTIYQTVPAFRFLNQDSMWVTEADIDGKVFVADFFFTSCPTICPVMKKEMLEVYQAYKNSTDVLILSHTIDPEFDDVALLKNYAQSLSVNAPPWHFLTGDKDAIYNIATDGYYATAYPDENEPGGYVHSGGFILVDRQKRVRGVYDGTSSKEVQQLIKDIKRLLSEK